jgi:hypothetical protein
MKPTLKLPHFNKTRRLYQKISQLHQTKLRQNSLPSHNLSRNPDHKTQHGEPPIPTFGKVSKAELFIAFH